jgi:hypothetical protein
MVAGGTCTPLDLRTQAESDATGTEFSGRLVDLSLLIVSGARSKMQHA